MSYAIISLGGKQYRVSEGQRLLVDRLPTEDGKTFTPDVLLVGGNGAEYDQICAQVLRVIEKGI